MTPGLGVVLLGLVMGLGGCTALPASEPSATGGPASAYRPVYEPANCQVPISTSYQVECGYLTVPEDRSQPAGAQVRLHVAVFRSRASDPEPDPVFHLVGGPGGDLLGTLDFYLRAGGDRFLEHRDYVLFNQRGTRYAEPSLYCPGQEQLRTDMATEPLDFRQREAAELEFWRGCRNALVEQRIDLAEYNSAENAADVNDLRLALGYETVNLYGISYGTRLALTVLRDYPKGVRSVILDSVYPPQVALQHTLAANAHRAFEQLFQDCADHHDCQRRYPDLREVFYRVIDRLNAEPVTVHVESARLDVHLDGDLFLELLFGTMYRTDALPWVPAMIGAADQGKFEPFQAPLEAHLDAGNLSLGMHYALQCVEEVAFESYEAARNAAEGLPPQLAEHFTSRFMFDVCDALQLPAPDPRENEAVHSDVPALILAGEYDPITPPEWGGLTAATLGNSFFYEFPGTGHGVMRSNECGLEIGLQFLADPQIEPDVSCLTTLSAPDFR